MAKKKTDNSAADDLIRSLLDEVNGGQNSAGDSESSDYSDETVDRNKTYQLSVDTSEGLPPTNSFKSSEDAPTQAIGQTAFRGMNADDRTHQLASPHTSEYDPKKLHSIPDKVIVGNPRAGVEATLAQAENLRWAQQRILELEKEVDRLRQDNDEISSAAAVVQTRTEELGVKVQELERERDEIQENFQREILVLKGQLQFKESELAKALKKIEDLEIRLKNDFRKVRVRERELENRLELLKAEKGALVRSKDDKILELKRKIDQLEHEIENYRDKCLELNKTLESQKEQFKRTVRALKLALTNLEVNNEDEVVPLKKAE